MSNVEVTSIKWKQIAKKLNGIGERARAPLSALKEFPDEDLYQISAPYGTQLIKRGKFDWSQLGQHEGIAGEFSGTPIPLGLVLNGSVELYTISTSKEWVGGHERELQRSVPVFLLGAGDFFGLFETFAPSFSQPELTGDAGGTTLIVLPHIGDKEKFKNLQRADTGRFFCGSDSNEKFVVSAADIEHLKITDGSNLNFGPFFANVLLQAKCPWRVELALFPNSFVEKMRKSPGAHQALLAATIAQLSLTCVRLGRTDELNSKIKSVEKDHILAVSMIAHGYRPGFTAVLETPLDEAVLPAKAIHKLMYELHVFENGFFPAIFRPSFSSEPSLYFLKRPYFGAGDKKLATAQKIQEIVSGAHKCNSCSNRFVATNAEQLQKMLEGVHVGVSPAAKINLGSSTFISGGIIRITPIGGSST